VQEGESGLAVRAAWLYYIGNYTQADIARRLRISRVKANRLIAEATISGLVRVFVEGNAAECVALEDRIVEQWALDFCVVSPNVDDHGPLPLRTLAASGAHYLHGVLERGEASLIGIGHGRTLAEVAKHLPRVARPEARFVSLLGSLTRHAAANPYDVIHTLTEVTGAESYYMPAPFFADSVEDKGVLLAQKRLHDVFSLAAAAELYIIGIGEVGPNAHMLATGTITQSEFHELQEAGAVGEALGRFVDASGRPVVAEINERAIAVRFEDLKGRQVVAIAGGEGKVDAIKAILESRVITGLITDETTARALVEEAAHGEEATANNTRRKQQRRGNRPCTTRNVI
jgi:DNA-binding transcriptional regulator LsrR (DeoR family)